MTANSFMSPISSRNPPALLREFARIHGRQAKRPASLKGALLAMLVCATPASPQEGIEVRGGPTCAECRVVLEPYLSLGGGVSPGIGGSPFWMARDAAGRFWVTTPMVPGEIGVYGQDGKILTTLGGVGQGPSEFLTTRQILAVGRTVSVLDPVNQRETVFDLDFHVVRTAFIQGYVNEALALNDSIRVFNINLWTPERVGYPLHLVDGRGSLVASFGYVEEVARQDMPLRGWRVLAASSGGKFWAARASQYLLERWTVAGEKRLSIVRSVPWFRPHDDYSMTPPPPLIGALWEAPDGLLWVAIRVADPEWERAMEIRPGRPKRVVNYNKFYDTILEVIDPEKGEVLASRRVDPFLEHFLGGGLMASYREDESGWPFVQVWRISMDHSGKEETK
ncbi:MAG: hypothetical protein Q8N53_08020 [Longimicrobiales bacterium]|nr:hypothetical protein [Longimicrobiales bacterium]